MRADCRGFTAAEFAELAMPSWIHDSCCRVSATANFSSEIDLKLAAETRALPFVAMPCKHFAHHIIGTETRRRLAVLCHNAFLRPRIKCLAFSINIFGNSSMALEGIPQLK
jgi:hypothetical protein